MYVLQQFSFHWQEDDPKLTLLQKHLCHLLATSVFFFFLKKGSFLFVSVGYMTEAPMTYSHYNMFRAI